MLYRSLPVSFDAPAPEKPQHPTNRMVGGAGGWGRLVWLRGQRAEEQCPVCSDPGPHTLVLSVPSLIMSDLQVTFARCRRCDCKFVTSYRPAAYEESHANEAPLRFYVEQGAGIDFLARSIFVAAQTPVRKYLDVGCGFGFGPDMATRIFGWNSVGVDPGPLAAAGRDMLGVRIESDMLTIERSLKDGPYDAVAAMEVVEHIAKPHDFLRTVRDNLTDSGIFILSTPNGRYLDTSPNGDMLLPILSPGYHAVLYTAGALSSLLETAGFPSVAIEETSSTLFVVASASERLLHTDIMVDRANYIGYLRSRFRDASAASPVHIGLGYRLLRCLTEDKAYHEALEVFDVLRNTTFGHLGVDMAKPLDIAGRVLDETLRFADIPGRYPFCLAGILFCMGAIAADHQKNAEIAASYFLGARFSAQMLLRALNEVGMSDGELAALPSLAAGALRSVFQEQ